MESGAGEDELAPLRGERQAPQGEDAGVRQRTRPGVDRAQPPEHHDSRGRPAPVAGATCPGGSEMTDEVENTPQEGEETDQQQRDEGNPETFDADYVKKLRQEAAKYRTEAKANADAAKK